MTDFEVSQSVLEVGVLPTPELEVSQVVLEVGEAFVPDFEVSQLILEVGYIGGGGSRGRARLIGL